MLPAPKIRRSSLLTVLAAFLLTGGLVACDESVAPERLEVVLATVPDTLDIGDSLQMSAVVMRPNDLTETMLDRPLTWTTSDSLVATVDQTGKVRPRAPGSVTITAKTGINSGAKTLIVAHPLVVSITGPATIPFGDSVSFAVSVTGRDQQAVVNPTITWSTPDTVVGRLSSAGQLRARGYGSVRVIATYATRADTHVVSVPVASLAPALVATTVGIGQGFKCVLVVSGQAFCEGNDGDGQKGDGPGGTPGWSAVASDARFTQIEGGQYGACALSTDQRMYCWGYNGYDEHSPIDTLLLKIEAPRQIETDLRFVDITHTYHGQTCGVSTSNVAYCWGHNDFYQAGRLPKGARVNGIVPVNGGLLLKEVDGNGFNTCGTSTTGALYCWGAGGEILTKGISTPDPVHIPFSLPLHGVAIGLSSGCALTAEGAAVCWGTNGALGNGMATGSPTAVLTPVYVSGDLRFTRLAGTANGTCGITVTEALYCWGYARMGFLELDPAVPVQVAPGLKFRHMHSDLYGRLCAVTVAGALHCFVETYVTPPAPVTSSTSRVEPGHLHR